MPASAFVRVVFPYSPPDGAPHSTSCLSPKRGARLRVLGRAGQWLLAQDLTSGAFGLFPSDFTVDEPNVRPAPHLAVGPVTALRAEENTAHSSHESIHVRSSSTVTPVSCSDEDVDGAKDGDETNSESGVASSVSSASVEFLCDSAAAAVGPRTPLFQRVRRVDDAETDDHNIAQGSAWAKPRHPRTQNTMKGAKEKKKMMMMTTMRKKKGIENEQDEDEEVLDREANEFAEELAEQSRRRRRRRRHTTVSDRLEHLTSVLLRGKAVPQALSPTNAPRRTEEVREASTQDNTEAAPLLQQRASLRAELTWLARVTARAEADRESLLLSRSAAAKERKAQAAAAGSALSELRAAIATRHTRIEAGQCLVAHMRDLLTAAGGLGVEAEWPAEVHRLRECAAKERATLCDYAEQRKVLCAREEEIARRRAAVDKESQVLRESEEALAEVAWNGDKDFAWPEALRGLTDEERSAAENYQRLVKKYEAKRETMRSAAAEEAAEEEPEVVKRLRATLAKGDAALMDMLERTEKLRAFVETYEPLAKNINEQMVIGQKLLKQHQGCGRDEVRAANESISVETMK